MPRAGPTAGSARFRVAYDAAAPGAPLEPFWTFSLQQYHWGNRPLLLFAISADDPDYRRQKADLDAHAAGLIERDIVLIECLGTRNGHVLEPGVPRQMLQVEDIQELRLHFAADLNGFTLVLIGKDGTEKRRETEAVAVDALFEQIDAMPMRREEMGRDGGE